MLLCEEHIKFISSSILSLLEQSLVCSVQKFELHALHTKHCSCYNYGISLCSISHYTIFEYMGAIWIAWLGMAGHRSCYVWACVGMGAHIVMLWVAMDGHGWAWVQFKRKMLGSASNTIWPFKIYLSQNNPSKRNPILKMKTSLEVLNIICLPQRTQQRRALSLQRSRFRWSILNSSHFTRHMYHINHAQV